MTSEEIERAIRDAEDAREFAEDLAFDKAADVAYYEFAKATSSIGIYLVVGEFAYGMNLNHIDIPISDQFTILF